MRALIPVMRRSVAPSPLRRSSVALVSSLLCLSGCVTAPPQNPSAGDAALARESWSSDWGAASEYDGTAWVEEFSDPRLAAMIEEALQYNRSLQQAAYRLEGALANSVAQRSERYPTIELDANSRRNRRNAASGVSQTPTAQTYGVSGSFRWEFDLWGKLRNGARADLATEEAALADYEAARLSLSARVAKAWYRALEAEKQLELETQILEALRSSSRIVEENFENGIARALDVRLVRANIASSTSDMEQRRRSLDTARRDLEVLLGRYPAAELQLGSAFPELKDTLDLGVPSDVLLRRPDVVAAERRLAAAEQRRYEARKARLPSITINLSRGTNASELANAFELMEQRIWSQSLNIGQTLFAGSRLRANQRRARALHEQTVAGYAQVVLEAFQEVEEAVFRQDSYARDFAALRVAQEESIAAEALAWEQYQDGLSGITTALDATRRAIRDRRAFLQVTHQRVQSRLDLYLALGGGIELPDA